MTPQQAAELTFLALAVWREARGESRNGKAAVAHVILHRAAHPGWWGKDLLAVVFQPWQFSSLTDPHDPQLINWPKSDDASWIESLAVSAAAIEGTLKNPAPGADSYHDISIKPPYWAKQGTLVAEIGRLRFYTTAKIRQGGKTNG